MQHKMKTENAGNDGKIFFRTPSSFPLKKRKEAKEKKYPYSSPPNEKKYF